MNRSKNFSEGFPFSWAAALWKPWNPFVTRKKTSAWTCSTAWPQWWTRAWCGRSNKQTANLASSCSGTIREYGLEKMAASGEQPLTRRAHAAYCLVLAEDGAAQDAGGKDSVWLDRFDLELDNFRAALEWLTETGNAEWGLRLGVALFRFWEMREYLAEGRDRLGKLLKLPQDAKNINARMRALFAAGVLAGAQGDYVSADALIKQSLEIARNLDDKRSIAISLNALAVTARDQGDLAASRALFEESLVLWREQQDSLAVARALSNLGSVVKLQKDYPQARSFYEESLSIFRELGDTTGIAWALNHQGDVAREQGDSAAARSLLEQSVATFRELNDSWGIAGTLADLGNLAREQTRLPRRGFVLS